MELNFQFVKKLKASFSESLSASVVAVKNEKIFHLSYNSFIVELSLSLCGAGTICRVQVTDACLRCQAESKKDTQSECRILVLAFIPFVVCGLILNMKYELQELGFLAVHRFGRSKTATANYVR